MRSPSSPCSSSRGTDRESVACCAGGPQRFIAATDLFTGPPVPYSALCSNYTEMMSLWDATNSILSAARDVIELPADIIATNYGMYEWTQVRQPGCPGSEKERGKGSRFDPKLCCPQSHRLLLLV